MFIQTLLWFQNDSRGFCFCLHWQLVGFFFCWIFWVIAQVIGLSGVGENIACNFMQHWVEHWWKIIGWRIIPNNNNNKGKQMNTKGRFLFQKISGEFQNSNETVILWIANFLQFINKCYEHKQEVEGCQVASGLTQSFCDDSILFDRFSNLLIHESFIASSSKGGS